MNSGLVSSQGKIPIYLRNNAEIPKKETGILTSAPCPIVSEHAFPSAAKSAERMEGAMMADGDMAGARLGEFSSVYGFPKIYKECATVQLVVAEKYRVCGVAFNNLAGCFFS